MSSLTLEKLKKLRPLTKTLPVDAWGGNVTIKKMMPDEKVALTEKFKADRSGNIRNEDTLAFATELAARSLVDDDGNRTFDNDDGREWLASQDEVLAELCDEILKLNGLGAATPKKRTATKKARATKKAARQRRK